MARGQAAACCTSLQEQTPSVQDITGWDFYLQLRPGIRTQESPKNTGLETTRLDIALETLVHDKNGPRTSGLGQLAGREWEGLEGVMQFSVAR